ncbi:hypothetical protein ACQP1W_02775 [Spirillospora sp. CA-255316]
MSSNLRSLSTPKYSQLSALRGVSFAQMQVSGVPIINGAAAFFVPMPA